MSGVENRRHSESEAQCVANFTIKQYWRLRIGIPFYLDYKAGVEDVGYPQARYVRTNLLSLKTNMLLLFQQSATRHDGVPLDLPLCENLAGHLMFYLILWL